MVKVTLASESATVSPGQSFWVAVQQKISPGWHTYWVNPGDAGEQMVLDWRLPDGFKAGDIQWPLPDVQPVATLTNYGYSGEAWFLVRMQAPETLQGERVTLAATARWLACENVCIPEQSEISLTLPVAAGPSGTIASSQAEIIQRHAARLPSQGPWKAAFLLGQERVRLDIEQIGAQAGDAAKVRFFPLEWGQIDNSAPQKTALSAGNLSVEMLRGDLKAQPLEELKGLLVTGAGEGRRGYWIGAKNAGVLAEEKQADVAGSQPPAARDVPKAGSAAAPDTAARSGIGFFTALLFAVLGGVILNLMPCVFPVLSLKVLSLAKYAGKDEQAAGRRQGMAYFAGVIASFAVLAVLLLSLRAAGGAAGWGFQFQSPEFVLLMIAIFFALGLSLSGVFSVGGSLMGTGDALTRRNGLTGTFFTGVLAVVVATPCTAPFMGAALGYALTKSAAEAVAVLLALGVGFASPLVLLSVSPHLRHMLPKPGAWMETLKQVMAFPMYASAAWLVWVLSIERGSDGVLAAAVAVVGIGFAAWLAGRLQNAGGVWRWAPLAVAVALMISAAGMLSAAPVSVEPQGLGETSGFGEPFSPERLDTLRAEGHPVFVNLTAAWCITCKVNERMGLNSERVRAEFKRRNVAYLKGDWTNNDPRITEVLRSFNRVGVPLYLIYPPKAAGGQPDVLPQLLTESIVMDHLSQLPLTKAEGDLPNGKKQ